MTMPIFGRRWRGTTKADIFLGRSVVDMYHGAVVGFGTIDHRSITSTHTGVYTAYTTVAFVPYLQCLSPLQYQFLTTRRLNTGATMSTTSFSHFAYQRSFTSSTYTYLLLSHPW